MDLFMLIVRWSLLGLAIVLMGKSFRGFYAFGRGDQWPLTYTYSLIFLYAVTSATFQSSLLIGGWGVASPQRVALSLTFALLTTCHAVWGAFWLGQHPIGYMRPVYRHVSEALAIATLAEVDPAAAKRLAAEAVRLTAECLVAGRCESDGRN